MQALTFILSYTAAAFSGSLLWSRKANSVSTNPGDIHCRDGQCARHLLPNVHLNFTFFFFFSFFFPIGYDCMKVTPVATNGADLCAIAVAAYSLWL